MDHFNTSTEVFNWIRAPFFALCAICFVIDWIRRRCWLPTYIHVIALITFVGSSYLMYLLTTQYPHDHPVSVWTSLGCSLFLTAIVYVVFILYGGADAAWTHRETAAERAIEEAGVPDHILRQRKREAIRQRCFARLHLGWGTALTIIAALADSILIVIAFGLPWWVAIPVAALTWAGMIAFFLRTETYSPEGVALRYLAIVFVLIAFLRNDK